MRDARDVLVNDGSFIKDLGRVVRCGANEFHASLIRLMVRTPTGKGGQERVVNINHRFLPLPQKTIGKDLHVARQYNQIDTMLAQVFELLRLSFGLCLRPHGNVQKGQTVVRGRSFEVRMVGNDRSEEHTSELQSPDHLVCRLLLEKKKTSRRTTIS